MKNKISKSFDPAKVIEDEGRAIAARRKKLNLPLPKNDLIGVALSGGGVRSATISLGVLEVLKDCGFLEKADYLSSVSGGGYTASYVHTKLIEQGSGPDAFEKLFTKEDIDKLRNNGSYLASGFFGWFRLAGAFIFSFFMNLIWVVSLFVLIGAAVSYIFNVLGGTTKIYYCETILFAAIIVLFIHFFLHGLRNHGWSSNILYNVEGILLFLAAPYAVHIAFRAFAGSHGLFTGILLKCAYTNRIGEFLSELFYQTQSMRTVAIFFAIFIFIGFFANPNILTFHRFYRDSLARAYLFIVRGVDSAFKLFNINPGKGPDEWGAAPYPLINTCLNLLGRDDELFAGTSTNEHFILSPLYCGSALTGYAPSSSPAYRSMTLATAMAVSGAAVNSEMGHRTNKFLAFVMTILNLRLGYWAPNPKNNFFPGMTWWPFFHITELLSRTNTKRRRVLLSDGGHIENLGIFELLRRRCRLIFAVDAGADPDFKFSDLRELVVQARNILGLKIDFPASPETIIRPVPSCGYSQEHFVIGSISDLPGADESLKNYRGILVYLKSSLKAPKSANKSREASYVYKTWHTTFPHEPTSDQFFDPPQWDAYYTLGRHMTEEVLSKVMGDKYKSEDNRKMTSEEWFATFEKKLAG